jgi:hypothetical protein
MARFSRARVGGRLVAVILLVALVVAACAPVGRLPSGERAAPGLLGAPPGPSATVGQGLNVLRGPVPFPFEENRGQAPADLEYLLRAGPMQVGFASGGPRFLLAAGGGCDRDRMVSDPAACAEATPRHPVTLELVGAAEARPTGTVPSETIVSYLKGRPEEWLVGVPAFHQVSYAEAWPGIDVQYERGATGLKSTYRLAAGADPSQIRLAWNGAGGAALDEDGALVLTTPGGTLRESAPVAWQDAGAGQRRAVEVRFALLADGTDGRPMEVGLTLGAYDPTRPLTVDPFIEYST